MNSDKKIFSKNEASVLYGIINRPRASDHELEHYLNITVGNIHAAMAASDQCSCTLAAWATNELSKLNIIMAVIDHFHRTL